MRDLIVTLRLPPGTALREDELMRDLGLGRHAAARGGQALALEGLVEVRPRSGTYVTDVEATDIVHIAEVRAGARGAGRAPGGRPHDRRPARERPPRLDAELVRRSRAPSASTLHAPRRARPPLRVGGGGQPLPRRRARAAVGAVAADLAPRPRAGRRASRPRYTSSGRCSHALVAGDEALAEARMLVHVQAFETEIMDAFSR
jgi:hypothetical protein